MNAKTIDAFASGTVGIIKRVIDPLKAEIAALQHEVAALKARPLQKWAGPYMSGTRYTECSLVTKAGSLWAATKTTTEAPGNSADWRLIVKRGGYDPR